MRAITMILFASLLMCAQPRGTVLGQWETRSGAKKEVILIVAIKNGQIGGTLRWADPSGKSVELPLIDAKNDGEVLTFSTDNDGEILDWTLTPGRGGRAELKGGNRLQGEGPHKNAFIMTLTLFKKKSK